MYAVVRYFNYRKDVSFSILKTFNNQRRAESYALLLAEEEYGDEVVEGVEEPWVQVDEVMEGLTHSNGYGQYVYTVIEIPDPVD